MTRQTLLVTLQCPICNDQRQVMVRGEWDITNVIHDCEEQVKVAGDHGQETVVYAWYIGYKTRVSPWARTAI